MKNIVQFDNDVQCHCCDLNGFFCCNPKDTKYTTCPLCGDSDFKNTMEENCIELYEHYYSDDFLEVINNIPNNNLILNFNNNEVEEELHDPVTHTIFFCERCKILFSPGCIHANNDGISDVYNGHLVGKWKYMGHEYYGLPNFSSSREYFKEIKNIEIKQKKKKKQIYQEQKDRASDCKLSSSDLKKEMTKKENKSKNYMRQNYSKQIKQSIKIRNR